MRTMRGARSAWVSLFLVGAWTLLAPRSGESQERPGWIGVSVDVVTTSDDTGSRTTVLVTDVQPGSPAAAAGIQPGDTLMEVNDMHGPDALREMAQRLRLSVGDPVRLVLRRNAQQREITIIAAARPQILTPPKPRAPLGPDADSMVASIVRAMDSMRVRLATQREADRLRIVMPRAPEPGAAPSPPAAATPRVWVDASGAYSPLAPYVLGRNRVAGAEVIDVRPDLARYFGVEGGVLVVDVPPGTLAEAAQLRAGDVIVQLGDTLVRSVEDLRFAVSRTGNAVPVSVIRHGEQIQLVLPR
ncbi:MAG: PDZ domain-containing protein [Gemmatimonadota bacterium]